MQRIRELQAIRLRPLGEISLELASRTTVLTGPNGAGKTAFLELDWWALTGESRPLARYGSQGSQVRASLEGEKVREAQLAEGRWQDRMAQGETPAAPVIMAAEDGTFQVWDPLNPMLQGADRDNRPHWLFGPQELWYGKPGRTEGALRDLGCWEAGHTAQPAAAKPRSEPEAPAAGRYPTAGLPNLRPQARDAFLKAMGRTLAKEVSFLDPERVPGSIAPSPVLQAGDGRLTLVQQSSGLRRAASMAHLAAWSWEEHIIQAELGRKTNPHVEKLLDGRKSLGLPLAMLDLPEQGLHPVLQRGLVPAL